MGRRLFSIKDVLDADLCISCGACTAVDPYGQIRLHLDETLGKYTPLITEGRGTGAVFEVCPGKGLPLQAMAGSLFPDAPNESFELGRYRRLVAAHASSSQFRENAASGGVMTQIAAFLLEQGKVDGALVSAFSYGMPGPRASARIAYTREDLLAAQGSKYCPTNTNSLIPQCVASGKRYLFVGTPCQVGALRLSTALDHKLSDTFPFAVANFCGGYRDYGDLDHLIRRHRMDPAKVVFFRFRGGGQPGTMLIRDNEGHEASEPYPDYGRHGIAPKQKRCVFCLDATGELADFACGDAWIPRFLGSGLPWSLVVTRTPAAEAVLDTMTSQGQLTVADVTSAEVVESQRHNLESKKFRQRKRMLVCTWVGMTLPEWDTPLPATGGSYWQEIHILLGKLRARLGAWLGRQTTRLGLS